MDLVQGHLRHYLHRMLKQEEALLTELLDALMDQLSWLLIWLHWIPQFIFGLPLYFVARKDIFARYHDIGLLSGARWMSPIFKQCGVIFHDEVIDIFLYTIQCVFVHLIIVIV